MLTFYRQTVLPKIFQEHLYHCNEKKLFLANIFSLKNNRRNLLENIWLLFKTKRTLAIVRMTKIMILDLFVSLGNKICQIGR
jgi:hypothetical protein